MSHRMPRLLAAPALLVSLGLLGSPALGATGHVVDPDGKPVPGARACLMVAGSEGLCSVTDASGYYGLPDSSVPWVRIVAKGFLPKQVSAVDQESPIALERAATLRVRVADAATGAALAKGQVFILYPSGKKIGPLPINAMGVQISSLEPGEIVVQASSPGHSEGRSETVRLHGGEEREVVIKLASAGSP